MNIESKRYQIRTDGGLPGYSITDKQTGQTLHDSSGFCPTAGTLVQMPEAHFDQWCKRKLEGEG